MNPENIRNFVIIAHVDHGKSTLADRLLETTGTVEARRMKPQYLDQLELERERGITIKMAPVRMHYRLPGTGEEYLLHLIDTPGHSDFSYEVSRALNAVEGAVLVVDATQGVQAQTLSVLRRAKEAGLALIGAINKVDLPSARIEKAETELAELLDSPRESILRISGKTGAGVPELLDRIIRDVPPPRKIFSENKENLSALIFDSQYDDHRGILAYVRIFQGQLQPGQAIEFLATGATLKAREVGSFAPELKTLSRLESGEIGYIATGLKDPSAVRIGDTVALSGRRASPLPGYREPAPVIFIAFYPDGDTEYEDLLRALERLRLNDPALSFEPDANEALGRGLKAGFLGQLHFEIISDRLKREFDLEFITTFPSIAYRVRTNGGEVMVSATSEWPARVDSVMQPIIRMEILTATQYLNDILGLAKTYDLEIEETANFGDSIRLTGLMPLSELIRDFDDRIKSVSSGYASFSYEIIGEALASVVPMDILIANEVQPALSRIVARKDVEREARQTVERLKELLPKVQFTQAIQARVDGRIIARETIPALKKLLGDFGKNGGDRTRKMKLWKKQQKGKARLKETGRVSVPIEVFREVLKK